MWANWICATILRSTPARRTSSKARTTKGGVARSERLHIDLLEDRSVPSAFRLGSTAPDTAYAVAADSSGNLYVAGSFSGTVDFDPGPGTANLINGGQTSSDAFLAKYTSSGSLIWVGQLVDSSAEALAVDAAGAVYVTGNFPATTDFDLGAGVSTLTTGSSIAAYVAKYNPDRTLAWAKRLGGQTAGLSGDEIALDAAGNVYTTGVNSNGTADMDPGAGTFNLTNSSGNANSYISKLDPAGNFVWAKQFANDPSIAAGVWTAGLGVDAGQNVYITGVFTGRVDFDTSATTTYPSTFDVGFPYGDGYVAKLNSAGDLAYLVHMGSTNGRDDGNGLAVDAAGNAFVTGQFTNTLQIDATAGDTSFASAGNEDIYVMKLTTTGSLDWARRIGSSQYDGGLAIVYDGTSNLYLTGYYGGTVDFDPNAGVNNVTSAGGFTDVFALKLQSDSTFVNAWSLGGADYEFGNDIALSSANEVAVVGRFRSTADFDPGPGTQNLTSAGDDDAFVAVIPQGSTTNLPPVASDGSLTTDEDTAANGTLVATDADGNALTYSLVGTTGAHGVVTITNAATGAYTYTPDANYFGPASFTFKANDGQADSNTATVSITVRSVNDAPTAQNDAYSTDEDVQLQVAAPGVLANDSDIEGSSLGAILVAGPAHGTLTLNANGSFTYKPALNFNGTDSFTYKANDGAADSNVATVTITVRPVNDAPFPSPVILKLTTAEDTALSNQVHGVDVDGDSMTFSQMQGPDHGALVFNSDGTFTYTPAANYFGPDAFVFRVSDPSGASNLGGVSITVTPVNDAPSAAADAYSVDEDGTLNISVNPVTRLRMFSEPGDFVGQGLTYDLNPASATFNGSKNFDNGASLSVTQPPPGEFWFLDFAAPDAAVLTPGVYLNAMRYPFQSPGRPGLDVSGDGRGSNTLTGQFTVYDVNFNGSALTRFAAAFEQHSEGNAPALVGWIMFNSTFGAGGGVLANDTDVESDLLLGATLVTGPAHGTLNWRGDGTFTYSPDANFNGTDTFTYRTNDGRADSNIATVTITVKPVNDPPVAADDSATTDEDTAKTISVLTNDIDVDGDSLLVSAITQPAHGTATINADGTVTYTPAANYNGADSFTYTASDGNGGTATATVSLTVRPVNDAPVASDDSAITDEDTAVTINVLANDTDVDGDALTPVLATGPSHGTVVLNADGTFSYTPAANFNGTDSFTYRATDGSLDSNLATVLITVRPVNDAPTAADDNYATNQDQSLNILPAGVLTNDQDVDGNALSAVLVGGPSHGTLALNPNGSFLYTPALGFNGTDTFSYRASDGSLDSNVATVTILVNPTANTEGKVTGAGFVDHGLRLFSVNVISQPKKNGFDIKGKIRFRDRQNRFGLCSTSITSFQIDATGTRAVISGTAKVNGRGGYTFTVYVADLGEPGVGKDTFRIVITGPGGLKYDSLDYALAMGLLDGGNLQVRRKV